MGELAVLVASPPVATVLSTASLCVKVNAVLVLAKVSAVFAAGVAVVGVAAAVVVVVSIGLGPPSSFSALERSLM